MVYHKIFNENLVEKEVKCVRGIVCFTTAHMEVWTYAVIIIRNLFMSP